MSFYEYNDCSFYRDFDGANVDAVIPKRNSSYKEFDIKVRSDCAGTKFMKNYRTWFYFGFQCGLPSQTIQFNVINLNLQARLYSYGMKPVYRNVPHELEWKPIDDFITLSNAKKPDFRISFKLKTLETVSGYYYIAFTYPYTYLDLQNHLDLCENKIHSTEWTVQKNGSKPYIKHSPLYFTREYFCSSKRKVRLDLLTISSRDFITKEFEPNMEEVFGAEKAKVPRSPSLPHTAKLSFDRDASVLNTKSVADYVTQDMDAVQTYRARKFTSEKKIIVLTARVHPGEVTSSYAMHGIIDLLLDEFHPIAIELRRRYVFKIVPMLNPDGVIDGNFRTDSLGQNLNRFYENPTKDSQPTIYAVKQLINYYHSFSENELFLYVDFHSHCSKRGIFCYGNHFEDIEKAIECRKLAYLLSYNSPYFALDSCCFTRHNMTVKGKKDGLSREGTGRVQVTRQTGLVRSYTLEMNYHSFEEINKIEQLPRGANCHGRSPVGEMFYQRYHTRESMPSVAYRFAEDFGMSILDLTFDNPFTRLKFANVKEFEDKIRDAIEKQSRRRWKTASASTDEEEEEE